MTQSKVDRCVFFLKLRGEVVFIVAAHVDDCAISGKQKWMDWFKRESRLPTLQHQVPTACCCARACSPWWNMNITLGAQGYILCDDLQAAFPTLWSITSKRHRCEVSAYWNCRFFSEAGDRIANKRSFGLRWRRCMNLMALDKCESIC